MNLIQEMNNEKILSVPYWLPDNICYLSLAGSHSYAINTKDSDQDIRGICFPPRHILFPWENGIILGFGTQSEKFENWQQHHIVFKNKDYDIEVYSIVKFVELLRHGNPNILDIIFTPNNCVMHITDAGIHLRNNRKKFLSKKIISRFEGFCWNHIRNMKSTKKEGKRKDLISKFGFDTKDAGNIYRIGASLVDILLEGDYDIQRHKEIIKAIRAGLWTFDQLTDWFDRQLIAIDAAKLKTELPEEADELELRKILLECLEIHYGRLDKVIVDDNRAKNMLRKIDNIMREGVGAY